MPDFDKIREIKARARASLFAIPGVHCVAIGSKRTGGEWTEEPSIVAFVVQKKPLSDLAPDEVIPPEFDGIKTDVVESPIPQLMKEDEDPYPSLRGGIQIQSGGSNHGKGTLGFIAQSPNGQKIFAVTNHHVLLSTNCLDPDLSLKGSATPHDVMTDSVTINFSVPALQSISKNTLIAVSVSTAPKTQGQITKFRAILSATEGNSAGNIAQEITNRINSVAGQHAIATRQGQSSTLIVTPGPESSKVSVSVDIFGAKIPGSVGVTTSVNGNVITFAGQAIEPGGAYASINPGGDKPSFGVFVPIDAGADATAVATSVASALTKLIAARQLAPITASATRTKVTVNNAQEIECETTPDDRVGHPTNGFCSTRHHKCCSDRIGRVVAAALDVDAALIQLDGQQKYIAKIEDVNVAGGAVHGTHTITQAEALTQAGFRVQKRGRSTRLTVGAVHTLDAEGVIGYQSDTFPKPSFFHRVYKGALRIDPDSGHFSESGDSGSALLSFASEIVGLVFGGGADGHGLAMPIDAVTKAFHVLGIDIVVSTTTQPDTALTVPGPSPYASVDIQAASDGVVALPGLAQGAGGLWENVLKAEKEIDATPLGKELSEAFRRNVKEGFQLVTTNRRVAAVWQNNGGQQIFPGVLRALHNPDRRLPNEIGGKPLPECLRRIRRAFERYGSPGFAADLKQWGDEVIRLMSLSYREMMASLESRQPG